MQFRYDAFCGLYCGACEALLATRRDEVEDLAAELEISAADLRCGGCRSDTKSRWCRSCHIRDCAVSREVDYCFECDDYACEHLLSFANDQHSHHSAVLANLEQMLRQGVDAWLEKQKRRWTCTGCGRSHSWYEKTCPACTAELFTCVDEESS